MIPSLGKVKQLFGMIADHYPRRLGKLIFVNVGRPTLVFYNMVKPFIPEDVKKKIFIGEALLNS